ncbi:CPBP family intramembrane metalloprotease [Pseudomonas sp. D1-3]
MPLFPRLLLPCCPLLAGVLMGHIQPIGLLWALLFIALVLLPTRLPQELWSALVIIASVLLAAHLLPGFAPWVITQPQRISADAAPYQLRLSWDKLLVGCTLLAWWLGLPPRPGPRPAFVVPIFIVTLLAVPGLALLLGVVAWQPKWPELLGAWLAVNLVVAVLAEELLFRGLLQARLVSWLGMWPGILVTALLFGAVHIPFSPSFAMVAAVAGLGYGLVMQVSGRLSLATALHGLVNLAHFTLLSYPLRIV